MVTADDTLRAALAALADRAAQRDTPGGERSMARAVAAFNALTGHRLTETQGWRFMEILKIARGESFDDFIDGAAYAALAGEAAARADVRRSPEDRG